MTGIPLTRLSTEDSMRLMQMEGELHKRVIRLAFVTMRRNMQLYGKCYESGVPVKCSIDGGRISALSSFETEDDLPWLAPVLSTFR